MKKNKLIKSIAGTVVCSVMALGTVALAACNTEDKPETKAVELAAPVITLTDNVISWSAVDNADGYVVYEGETSVSTQTSTTYTVSQTAVGSYTYTVTATSTSDAYTTSKKSNSVTYTVNPVEVSGVALDKTELKVEMGKEAQLTATVSPDDAANTTVTWTSSDDSVATVDQTGKVTGVKLGTATITAKAGDKSATCAVEVTIPTKEALFELIPSNLEVKTYTENTPNGIFAILKDTKIRTRARENKAVVDYITGETVDTTFTASKSVQLDGTNRGISITTPAAGKFTMYLDNGSSGLAEGQKQYLVFTKPDGSTESLGYPNTGLFAITLDLPEAGTYTFTRGASNGTTDIYYAKFEATVPVTPIDKIQIADEGKVEYLLGQEFDPSSLQVQLVYTITQMVEPVAYDDSHLNIDYSTYDSGKEGSYTVYLTYTDDDGNEFTANYDVTVYGVTGIELGFNKIVQGNNGYNGTYENVSVKQFYFVGDTLDTNGLTVNTLFNDGDKVIVTSGYTIDPVDMSTAGKKTVVVRWNENIQASYDIYVAAKPTEIGETVVTNVSAATADGQVGVANASGAYQFKTIKQALDFLENLGLENNVNKVINLAEGTYTEKVEINIPNLTIKGSTDATKTVIEWDALYGDLDESGYTHTTDSTATLNVRKDATGFVIEGVTISNKYNSEEYFDEVKGPKYAEHRALALLVQADKVVIDNCRMLGYQDTVEFFTGRQVVMNSYIQGRTDFIFGTNSTTYFYNCEIRSIISGGYITAFKGANKGASDYVTYGAIFDECTFTAPADVVTANNTALGRPWGEYAAVAVINSELGGHISTKPSSGAGAGERYVSMSGNNPYAENVKFVEYGNSGAGAITAEVKGMKMLDATTAANYSNYDVIFGTQNGALTYTSTWDGQKGVLITEKSYKFTSDIIAEAALHETEATGESIFDGDMIVYALNGAEWRAESSKSQAQFNAGCVIKVKVAGKVTVNTYGSTFGLPENVKINYVNGFATITIVATEASPIANGCYVTEIILDSSKEPAHVHEYGNWVVTEVPTEQAGGVAVRTCVECELDTPASQSVNLLALSEDNYAISASANAGKSIYTYTDATYGEIVFEADSLAGVHVHNYGEWVITATADAAGTATKTCTGEGTCDEPSIVVNIPALTDAAYTITNNTATLEAAGEGDYSITVDGVTVTFHAATPQKTINVIETTTNITFGTAGNYNTYINNVTLYATNPNGTILQDNGGNNSQIKQGTVLTIKVKAGANVSVSSYSGYTSYTVKINGVDYNNGTAETGTSWSYKAEEDCTIEFISGANNYFYGISVSYGLTEITANTQFASTNGVDSTSLIEFSGVQSHNNGEYWNIGKTGTITIKVAAGATVTIACSYWGNGITVNGTAYDCTNNVDVVYTATEAGEIVIGCKEDASNVAYVQKITVTFA